MAELERAPDFLFENVGSHGDIMPLLSVAAELARRGHRCQLLANEHFRTDAIAQGLGFYANASERIHAAVPGSTVSYLYFKLDRVREYFQRPRAFDERTVVVNTNAFGASEPLAEAYGLRTARLILFPVRIQSLISPAWPLGERAYGPGGERFLKVTLPAMYRAADSHPAVLARINEVRAQLGLPSVRSASYERRHVVAQAAMFPEWFGMPAEDWPHMEYLGFPLPPSTEPLPERVLEFLARFPRPLVFTTGTGFGKPDSFFEAAATCCTELNMPGIFLSPFLPTWRQKLGEQIAHFDHVELEALLRHAALIVHHGGMGTTARALQAGIPQVISPIGFDQPDNGHRVEILGAGRVVRRDRMSGPTFAAAVRELLEDSAVGSRLSGYRAALDPPRAVERCADLLERLAMNSPLLQRVAPGWTSAAADRDPQQNVSN
jgi:rhamnosyltransferase subunit B